MTFYKCGHGRNVVVLKNDVLWMSDYFVWKDTAGFEGDRTQCWDCWNKAQHLVPDSCRKGRNECRYNPKTKH